MITKRPQDEMSVSAFEMHISAMRVRTNPLARRTQLRGCFED